MNLLPFLSLLFICNVDSATMTTHCASSKNNESYFSEIPNEVFEEINISTVEDLKWNVLQLDIVVKPTQEYSNKNASIILSGNEGHCRHLSEHQFNLGDGVIAIPKPNHVENKLKNGCNYNVTFIVGDSCTYRYYETPELKPCQNFFEEDIFDSFPNEVLKEVTVNAFRKNAVRLNISVSAQKKYMNYTGNIVINSKMPKCNHPEEFKFSMNEKNLVVPRAEFPHSFINSGCEYIIDFEIDYYCITTTYEVPDFCSNGPQAKILEIKPEKEGIYKVFWDPSVSSSNGIHHITKIIYRIDDLPYDMFNTEIIIENQYQFNFSVLNLSMLPNDRSYQLMGIFVNDDECSNLSSLDFRVSSSDRFIFKYVAVISMFIVIISISLMFVPAIRTRIQLIFKQLSVAIHVPASQTLDKRHNCKKEEINPIYRDMELENFEEYEFPRRRLIFREDENTRRGFFGVVYIGKALDISKAKGYTHVAIKTLKDNAPTEAFEALIEEINTMKKIKAHGNHTNIVNFLGCCTIDRPHLMILEYVACGDLHEYLVDLRKEWASKKRRNRFLFPSEGSNGVYISPNTRTLSETSSVTPVPSPTETESTILYDEADEALPKRSPTIGTPALSSIELQNFALQIAKGMAFLESISIVHRDLAARNVLITETRILKISDFGMSRFGNYICRNNAQQPIRWMALESIEKCISTSKSDVWSFGIVLWEIGTLGAFPYDDISNDFILHYLVTSLRKGVRLTRPEICTDELYSLMMKCWSENTNDRPSFERIVEELCGEKRKIYIDFHRLNPAYIFPPVKNT